VYSYEAIPKRVLLASSVMAISAFLIVSPAAAQNESRLRLFEQQNHQPITPVGFVLKDTEESLDGSVGGYDDGVGNCRCGCGKRLRCRSKLWESSLNVGLNGATGSSEDINLVVGFNSKRVNGLNTFTTDLDYLFQKEESAVSKNRLYWLSRFERDIPDSVWSRFVDGWYEYDQFEDFESRIGLHFGAAKMLKKTDRCSLKGRFGLGASKKFHGPDTDWKPEILLGTDFDFQVTKRQKLKATVDYYPELTDFSSYRVNTRASWEVLIDEEANLSLVASAFDRYDSTPSPGDSANELDYWLTIQWSF
jgi:hypothetical protein